MRWIYLSPHLDDAVLSCGGLIHEQVLSKIRVEIWTICAGDPPEGELSLLARRLHHEWGTGSDTPSARREEDIAACQQLGARHRHLPFLDCIYRQGIEGDWIYPSDESIQGEVSRQDDITISTLRVFLLTILKPDDILICPLAIGRHVDHQMVRKAVEGLDRALLYYTDLPYIFNHPGELNKAIGVMPSELYPFSMLSLTTWQEAILNYASQISSLFGDPSRMRDAISEYYLKEHGMCLWKSG
jgi:LmbE family N-acetylglucosaminyl deacetylase